jgi:hypothetical protein
MSGNRSEDRVMAPQSGFRLVEDQLRVFPVGRFGVFPIKSKRRGMRWVPRPFTRRRFPSRAEAWH